MGLTKYLARVDCDTCRVNYEFQMGVGVGEAEIADTDVSNIVGHENNFKHNRFNLTVLGSSFTILADSRGVDLTMLLNQREDWFERVFGGSVGN